MTCVICEGTTVPAKRPKAVEREGRTAVIREVPVEICESCGEVYLDGEVAKRLDELFRQLLTGPVDQVVGHFEPASAA